ncbi:GNAT family N-acetyltransferase [Psychromarinibacter sp. C21-152]|uniref:GNAT family N-acetyltransferase n=1 Tax=Psychromarinibacter sediminicola TaxID=3033385 RepID=A0AAE3T9T2_9RHOB|nr:GNAT family N-acetyltransferase [Psychromarinibacter sediminicola]MDF0602960.1 GNAT family N-acetyltransferase [Psychromarinibacter sediminicola]
MIAIDRGDPRDPGTLALLQASHAMMQELFAPDETHVLSVEQLCDEDVRFFTARRGAQVTGCAALALRDGYGEIKSMFVAPEARGTGTADALMRMLEDEAHAAGLPWLRLEAGDLLHAAHRLYTRHGFAPCDPFGDDAASGSSVFMKKRLD